MEDLDLKELALVLWEKKDIIIIITSIFLIIGVIYSYFFVTPQYESYTSLLLGKNIGTSSTDEGAGSATTSDSMITQSDINLNKSLVSTYSELLTSKIVVRDVLNNLKTAGEVMVPANLTHDSLKNNIKVTSVKDTNIIKITVKNGDPALAKAIASELSNAFTQKVKEIYNINNVYVVDEPEIDNTPVNINHVKDIVIFVFIGLALSSMLVLIMELFTIKIKTISDIEKVTDIPILAELPKINSKKGGI